MANIQKTNMPSLLRDYIKNSDHSLEVASESRFYDKMGTRDEVKALEKFIITDCQYRMSYAELAGLIDFTVGELSESDIHELQLEGEKILNT